MAVRTSKPTRTRRRARTTLRRLWRKGRLALILAAAALLAAIFLTGGEPADRQADKRPSPPKVVAAEPAEPLQILRPRPRYLPPPAEPPAWRRHAVPFAVPVDKKLIAVVIDDLGIDKRNAARVIALPGPLTLAFIAYATGLAEQTKAARAGGHELMVHVPMEPTAASEDPGPRPLLTSLSEAEIEKRLAADLASFDGYIGINNHMGSKFTADPAKMAIVMRTLQSRGLMFLDSRTTPHSVASTVAQYYGVPALSRDVFLDNEQTPEHVRASLARTEAIARQKGSAIAIGHPHPVTIEALKAWLPGLSQRGFALVPVSALLNKNPSPPRRESEPQGAALGG